jgi:hypothetical protein
MNALETDFTGKFAPLDSKDPESWPMYSFERPAFCFWNGVANELKRRLMSEKAIKEFLQSKDTRWMLDQHGECLEELGAELVNKYMRGRV